jgi:hypothetical protein
MPNKADLTFERLLAGGRNSHAHGFYCPAAFPHGFGLRVYEAGLNKLEELDGEQRDEIWVRAATWRVREQFEHAPM